MSIASSLPTACMPGKRCWIEIKFRVAHINFMHIYGGILRSPGKILFAK